MTLFTRYIASIHIRLMLLCYGAFVSIYLIIDLLERVGKLTRAGGSFNQILLYFLWKLPGISVQILPLALLMATLLALGSISRTSELTAMRCSGAGLVRITSPIIVISLAVSLLNLTLSELIVPVSAEKMRYIEEVLIKKKSPKTFFRQGAIWYRDDNSILIAKLFDPATTALRGVTVWEIDNLFQPVARVDADEGVLLNGALRLKQAVQYRYSSGMLTSTEHTPEVNSTIQLSVNELKTVGKRAENMGFADLGRYCEKLEKGGYDATSYRTLLHSKLSAPFSPLVMAFLAIPFSLRGGRTSGPAVGIGISLIIGLSYFIVNAFLISFGQAGALPPFIAAWSANILFIATGVWLSLTINR